MSASHTSDEDFTTSLSNPYHSTESASGARRGTVRRLSRSPTLAPSRGRWPRGRLGNYLLAPTWNPVTVRLCSRSSFWKLSWLEPTEEGRRGNGVRVICSQEQIRASYTEGSLGSQIPGWGQRANCKSKRGHLGVMTRSTGLLEGGNRIDARKMESVEASMQHDGRLGSVLPGEKRVLQGIYRLTRSLFRASRSFSGEALRSDIVVVRLSSEKSCIFRRWKVVLEDSGIRLGTPTWFRGTLTE